MKRLFICVAELVITITVQSRTFNMKELRADPRGIESCMELINRTTEKASSEGEGTIYFPVGVYLTAIIYVKSNIISYTESGAVLRFSDRFEDYLPLAKTHWEGTAMNTLSPLTYAYDVENLTITGHGTLNGSGFKWWNWKKETWELIKKNGGKLPALNKLQRVWEGANEDLEISDYYKPPLERRMSRPPPIQSYEYNNVLIENMKVANSPFWIISPAFCDNVTVHGVTIYNPSEDPKGPNTDGVDSSPCRNARISDCFISVGGDCITVKSGRDADGRKYRGAYENITITDCVMLFGHGRVVIGSEMSDDVRRVTIFNYVFDGTDSGIRLRSSRRRRRVAKEFRVDNTVMKNIQRNAFISDLLYDKESRTEPVSKQTSAFRNVHLSNITGFDIKRISYIKGIEEMSVQSLSFLNINMRAEVGLIIDIAEDICFDNVDFFSQTGPLWQFSKCKQIVLSSVRSKYPVNQQSIVIFEDVDNAIINNCLQMTPVRGFYKTNNSYTIEGHNYWKKESFK